MQKTPVLLKRLLPGPHAVLFILLFVSVLTVGPRMLNIDGDLPRHLLMGEYVLENGAPPRQEIFSYIYEGRPYTPQEWLAGVIYYAAYRLLGLDGVVLLAGVLIAAAFTVLYANAIAEGASRASALLLFILGALVSSIHWITRPHLFTMLFLGIWLILTERLSRGRPVKLWIFPAIMVAWANIHGEFIAGFLVLAAYLAGWGWTYLFRRPGGTPSVGKKLGLAALLSLAACNISPAGFRTWGIVLGYVTNRYLLSRIAETRPPDFTQAEYWPLLVLLGTAIYLLVRKRHRFTPADFFLIAGFGLMSLLSARNAHLVGLVFPFILARAADTAPAALRSIEAALRQVEAQVRGSLLPMALAVLVGTLVLLGPSAGANRFEPRVFPVEAVRWLEANPQPGRMFNAFDWGGYILLHLWPGQKTFIESHTDVTGEATQQYETVVTLQEGWQETFERYDIAWAILPPDWPLTRALLAEGWQAAYRDGTAIILVRD